MRLRGLARALALVFAALALARTARTSNKVNDRQGVLAQERPGEPKTGRRHIRVVTIEAPPFMMKAQSGQDSSSRRDAPAWHGYCMDFFLELIKHLPYEISYEIYEAPDGKFGSKTREISAESAPASGAKNGSSKTTFRRIEYWNGLVGELERGKAVLALAPMAVMAERELAIDFTVPFYDLVGIQILLKRPEVPQDWFKFLTVLDNDVWLSIGIAYFATSFVIYIFDRLSPFSHKNLQRIERARERRAAAAARQRQGPIVPSGARLSPALVSGRNEAAKFYLSRATAVDTAKPSELAPISTMSDRSHAVDFDQLGCPTTTPARRLEVRPLGEPDAYSGPAVRRASQDYLLGLRARFGLLPAATRHATPPRQPLAGHVGSGAGADAGDDDDDDDDDERDDGKPDFNLRDSLWFCITSLTPQGGGEAPQNLSGRVVAGAWWLFCFIVIASYTANLAAFLTVSRLDIPIESLDDLAKQYRIRYAPIDGSAEQTYFERMAYIEEIFYNIWKEMSLNDSLDESERSKFAVWDYPISDKYTKIWSQVRDAGMPASQELALERVRASRLDDGFALLANANLVRYAVMTDCSLKAVGEEFSRKPVALGVAKSEAKLRDDLSYAILQLINRRFMEVLRERWWTNNPARVACNSNDESEGISIENIGGVFIIILAGIVLSFLVWAFERLAYKTKVEVLGEPGGRAAPSSGARGTASSAGQRTSEL